MLPCFPDLMRARYALYTTMPYVTHAERNATRYEKPAHLEAELKVM